MTSQEALKSYLEYVAKLQPLFSVEGFVLRHGRSYAPHEKTFAGKRGRIHGCFMNATHDALDTGRSYVEGFVTVHGVPIHHAWTVDEDGQIWDQTMRRINGDDHAYYGVAFSMEYLEKTLMKNEVYGLFDLAQESTRDLVSGKVDNFLAEGEYEWHRLEVKP